MSFESSPGVWIYCPRILRLSRAWAERLLANGAAMFSTVSRLAMPVIAVLAMVIFVGAAGARQCPLQLLTISFPIKMMLALTSLAESCAPAAVMRQRHGMGLRRPRAAGSARMADQDQKPNKTETAAHAEARRKETSLGSDLCGRHPVPGFPCHAAAPGRHPGFTATHKPWAQLLHTPCAQPHPGVHPESERGADRKTFMPLPSWLCADRGELAAQFMVTRLGVSLKKLAPDFQRSNPPTACVELPGQNIPALPAKPWSCCRFRSGRVIPVRMISKLPVPCSQER